MEVEEFFGKKQKVLRNASQKSILSENLTGLARLIRSNVIPNFGKYCAMAWRDISHSAVERNIGPDTTISLDFALNRLNKVVKNLNIYQKR